MKTNLRLPLLLGLGCAVTAVTGSAQVFFSEDFDADHTANWAVNASSGTHPVNLFFDYSAVGIPAAPHSSGGTTRGLKMQANTTGGVFGGVSVSPTGQSFSGDYWLRFDMWINFNGPAPAGGSGSTQVTGAGIGTAGTTPQWAGGVQDSIHFGVTGEGGSSVDYRAYSSAAATGYADASPIFAAGAHAGNRNSTDSYYALFGGNSAPAAQLSLYPQQTGATAAGAQAFTWHDVSVIKAGQNVTYSIDGVPIATVDASTVTLGGSDILLTYYDINATSSTDANAGALLFGLIDNVQVTAVPEPATSSLFLLGLGAWAVFRRRC